MGWISSCWPINSFYLPIELMKTEARMSQLYASWVVAFRAAAIATITAAVSTTTTWTTTRNRVLNTQNIIHYLPIEFVVQWFFTLRYYPSWLERVLLSNINLTRSTATAVELVLSRFWGLEKPTNFLHVFPRLLCDCIEIVDLVHMQSLLVAY